MGKKQDLFNNGGVPRSFTFIDGCDEFVLPKFKSAAGSNGFGANKNGDSHKGLANATDNVCKSSDPMNDKLKGKMDVNFPALPNFKVTGVDNGVQGEQPVKLSWSKVVKDPPPIVNNVVFDYCPRPVGISVVSPPVEVLKECNGKLKNCIVGTFSKRTKPYNIVVASERMAWECRGLINVSQKDSHIFIFKFNSAAAMNKVLSRGTWDVENQPILHKS